MVQNFTDGFTSPQGILYDGANIWVVDTGKDPALRKLNPDGSIALSTPVGGSPRQPIFDGTNIWVPREFGDAVSVVRAGGSLSGTLLGILTGNGLNNPRSAAFDGQRILVTNFGGDSVSLWRATDLSPLGSAFMGFNAEPSGACSDGVNFWITLSGTDALARF